MCIYVSINGLFKLIEITGIIFSIDKISQIFLLDEIIMESLGKAGVDIPEDDPDDITVTFIQFLLLMEELNNFDKDIDEEKLMQFIK